MNWARRGRYISAGPTVKKLLLTLFFLFSSVTMAKDICPVNTDIPNDMRLSEFHYSKENASIVIDFLSGVVKTDKPPC